MIILITGATGHIGSYLVPKLVRTGHDVIAVARNTKPKYPFAQTQWDKVQWIQADCRAEEKTGQWIKRLADIQCDIVIDLISFLPSQVKVLVDSFIGRIKQFVHCGSIWAYGPSNRIPHLEEYPREPKSYYGKNKAAIENYLMELYKSQNFPVTVIHPGHISGKYWLPIDPQGSINGLSVYEKLATGQIVYLPNNGLDSLHHVHAEDVAQVFERAIENSEKSIGQAFSAVAPYGMTLKGCCHAVAEIFGKKANIEFVSLEILEKEMGKKAFATTKIHLDESVIATDRKAREILGYTPLYTTEQIYQEFLEYMIDTEKLKIK